MVAEVEVRTYRFRNFELDLGAHQLRLGDEPVRLERRPFLLLVLLVSRHGQLVPREEIIKRLWPGNVVIDFDTGLNTLVRKVRQALGDSTEEPAFIETVAGLGYRFVAPVSEPATPAQPSSSSSPASPVAPSQSRRMGRSIFVIVLLLVGTALGIQTWRSVDRWLSPVSIAVLPIENLKRNDELSYLAAGLTEDTRASLAQIDLRNVRIVGHVSALAYAGADKPITQIGRELGVDYVVASSLRAEQASIRVTSRLVRTADNVQLWTASFDRELTSVLGLQREVSTAIAEQVRLKLSPEVTEAMARRQTLNPEAYDFFLRGRYSWSFLTPASSRQALEYFERAIVEDPEYSLAWAGIAQVLSTAPVNGDADPASVTSRARHAVLRAVQYGAELTEVQYALGYFNFFLEWDWVAAEAAFRSAVNLDPNNAMAHLTLGHVLSQGGNHVEARAMMRRARELDPLFSHTFAMSAQIAFQARDYPAALEFARQAIAINPEGWVGYLQLGQVLAELGEYDDAIEAYEDSERYSGGNSKAIAFRAYVLAKVGRAEEARLIIASQQAKSSERYVPPYAIAMIYAGLSEPSAAFEWLERAFAAHDVHLVFLPVDPRWDALRSDARFQLLLDRCRFLRSGFPLDT